MEGILLVVVVMGLFALISSNRFKMLRKMADKVFVAFQETATNKYEALNRWLNETGSQAELKGDADNLRSLGQLLAETKKPDLTIDQQVALENSISKLERNIEELAVAKQEKHVLRENTLSAYREAKNKTREMKKQYNETVMHYNNAVFLFPSNVFALIFGFKQRKTFVMENNVSDNQQAKDK